jgi:hypothetical protein
VFCAFKITHLFSVVLYLVRAVYEFDFRLVIKDKPNNWRPVESRSCNNTKLEIHVFDMICMLSFVGLVAQSV